MRRVFRTKDREQEKQETEIAEILLVGGTDRPFPSWSNWWG